MKGSENFFRRLRLFSSASCGASNVINSFLLSRSSATRPSCRNKPRNFDCFDLIEIFSCAVIATMYLAFGRCFRFFNEIFWCIRASSAHAFPVHRPCRKWPWLLQTRKRISAACKFGCCRKKDISAVVANGTRVKNVAETIFYANAAFLISSGRGKIFRDVARTWKVKRRA